MSVKKEASGRRSIQVEVEVPGTPEEVWQALATGPGISAWFVPATFEEEGGKPVAVTLDFGPAMDSRSVVTAWNPPHLFAREGSGWVPGSPPIATEFIVEARAGGTPDQQLTESLGKISTEIDSVTRQLASGAIDNLAIRTRYLDYKYGGTLDQTETKP